METGAELSQFIPLPFPDTTGTSLDGPRERGHMVGRTPTSLLLQSMRRSESARRGRGR